MAFRAKQDSSQEPSGRSGLSQLLEEVEQEHETGLPWWKNVGIFIAWAGGLAGAAAVVTAVLLLIVDLFSANRLFTFRSLSDWVFWATALLAVFGLLAPSSTDLAAGSGRKKQDASRDEDRTTRSIRRRLRKVYDPWRWRLWAAAVIEFGISALIALFS